MEKTILLSGIGGQGIQLLGKSLTATANEMGLNVCFFPTYTGMRRGGYSYCRIIISDGRIGSPSKASYDIVALMDSDSYDAFEHLVKKDGLLILNENLIPEIKERDDVTLVKRPFTTYAEETGNPLSFNVVLAGFFSELTGVVEQEIFREFLLNKVAKNDKIRAQYTEAFAKGVKLAQQ